MLFSQSVIVLLHFVAIFFIVIQSEAAHAQAAGTATQSASSAPPKRIVSLLPSLAESVCALGHCDKLVGVDRYTHWPAQLKTVPKMGGGLDPDIERILAAKPDLVLVADSARIQSRLRGLGLNVLTLEPKTHADVHNSLQALDKLLNGPDSQQAAKLWLSIQTQMDAASARIAPVHIGRRVYFEVGSGPWAAGQSSFIGESLARLGVANIIPANLGAFPQISPEFVVLANPQVIFINDKFAADLAKRPGWKGIAAVQERRVCALSAHDVDLLSRAGPRMGDAAHRMADCLARP